MPVTALALLSFWALTLFGLRSFVQWQKTGATGFKGVHGRPGSLPWLAGLALVLGIVFLFIAPIAALSGWVGSEMLLASRPLQIAGTSIAVAGTVATLAAQFAMGDAWRIGVDETEKTELVTNGLFAWVRNPIFSFMVISAVGFAAMVPNIWALAGLVLSIVGIEMQVRFVEEPYLKTAHGEAYQCYLATVGRFLPRLGKAD